MASRYNVAMNNINIRQLRTSRWTKRCAYRRRAERPASAQNHTLIVTTSAYPNEPSCSFTDRFVD